MTEKPPINVIAYYRVSTEYQAKTLDTIPLQRTACRKYAEKAGLHIVQEFTEEDGLTGETEDRPSYQAAKKRIMDPDVGGLLVYEMDRWARGDRIAMNAVLDFRDNKKSLFCARKEEVFQWDNEMQDILAVIKAMFSHKENERIHSRFAMGRERIENGEHPKWKKWNEWKYKGNVDKAQLVRDLKWGVPIQIIADRANVSRATIYNRIKEYGINYTEIREGIKAMRKTRKEAQT